MTSAYLLIDNHEVVVFEANDYVGGHTNTVDVALNGGKYAVDTGFIVFNEKDLSQFRKADEASKLDWQNSVMSFSVQCEKTVLIFTPQSQSTFIERRNLLRYLLSTKWDVTRFKRDSEALLESDDYEFSLSHWLHF